MLVNLIIALQSSRRRCFIDWYRRRERIASKREVDRLIDTGFISDETGFDFFASWHRRYSIIEQLAQSYIWGETRDLKSQCCR
jgi:hypothetical protein